MCNWAFCIDKWLYEEIYKLDVRYETYQYLMKSANSMYNKIGNLFLVVLIRLI